jgi:hypothetical protein
MQHTATFPTQDQLRAIQADYIARIDARLVRLTLSDLALLAETLEEYNLNSAPHFQSANGYLPAAIMQKMGVKVRVAEWHVVDGRCQHKRYAVGQTTRAKCGEIGDETWLEAWIA